MQILEDDKWINCDSKDQWVFLNARETYHRVSEVTGYRMSVIYHTPQHLHRLSSEDWDILRDNDFPMDSVWERGMSNQDESDDDSDVNPKVNELAQPAESPKDLLSRQTSPDETQGPLVELDDSLDIPWSSLKPTMQAILWLSPVARYQLRPDVVPGANPRLHKAMATLELKELDSHLQRARQGPMELTAILMCMANIIALRLSVKLGAQCQLGVLMLHLTKPIQEMGEDPSPETSMGICRAIAMIPTKMLWKWVPNIHSLVSLGPKPSKG